MDKKDRERLRKLHAMLGSSNSGERESAWRKLDDLLKRHSKSWNDVSGLLQDEATESDQCSDPQDAHASPFTADTNVFDLVHETLRRFVYFKHDCEYVAVTLWVLHTYVSDRFMFTPRLAVLSPVRGCGKSRVLDVLNCLALHSQKFDHTTSAVLFRIVHQSHPTLLLDEVDNLELTGRGDLRSVLNSGHAQGGIFTRYEKGQLKQYSTFAPVAFGAIGTLPLPLMHRSIVIHMERAPHPFSMERFDCKNEEQMEEFRLIKIYALDPWSRTVALNPDPEMPRKLHNRRADNWRVLIAIGDACHRGDVARESAIAISGHHQDEDPCVELLFDIRRIFNCRGVERLSSAELLSELHALDGTYWSDWGGIRNDLPPHKLSRSELSALLIPFRIRPRSIWRLGVPRGQAKSVKGYHRHQFSAAWTSYCDDGQEDTPAQHKEIRRLRLNRHSSAAENLST
jgi:hypothetical protein